MEKMANSIFSLRIARRDQTWMRCYVHILQNRMKSVFQSCNEDDVLCKVVGDVKAVKQIFEDSKQYEWNKNLPIGYRLVQDVETRF